MAGIVQIEMGNKDLNPTIVPGGPIQPEGEGQPQGKTADNIADALGSVLYSQFTDWRDARQEKENIWLAVLRAYNGMYDDATLQRIGTERSTVFVHLTRTKTMTAYSRIIDLMLGHGDHWGIKPTPLPHLTPETEMKAKAFIADLDPQFVDDEPALLEVAKMIADDAASKMEAEIRDQLVEEQYDRHFKTAVFECCQLGTGCIKGPFIKTRVNGKWVDGAGSGWAMAQQEETVPGLDSPSIWDIYPEPYATSVEDAIGIYERHVLTPAQLRRLANYPGFDAAAIEDILEVSPNGNHEEYTHEVERRRINGFTNTTTNNKRYDVYEYWGQISGRQLAAAGQHIAPEDMSREFQANVWFCGARTIRVQLNPLEPVRLPYQLFPYERVPFSIWGIGVGEQMTDSQTVLNASIRATLDNLGISSGPQVEVNTSLMADGEDPRKLFPWRIWLRKGGDPANPMLRFYQPENVSAGLMQIADVFRKFADEETSMPSYTHGEAMPGLNKTATGMSMLMGAANVTLKSIVKNIDTYSVEPMIRGFYDFNMTNSDDDTLKGDMQIEATGSTTLLAKEVQSQRLIQYAQMTANPIDLQIMGAEKRAGIQRAIAKSLDLDPDEVAADDPKKMQQGQPGAQPGAPLGQTPGVNMQPGQLPTPGDDQGATSVA